jgi:hypothetical protein
MHIKLLQPFIIYKMQFVDTDRSEYIINPECKKSFIETAHYTKVISTQKLVTIIYTTVWRNGSATIWLNPVEKSDILEMEGIYLTEYQHDFRESTDSCDVYVDLQDEHDYTDDEINEILESACAEVKTDYNYGEDDDEDGQAELTIMDCDPYIMENEGGWILDETHYYIEGKCTLTPINEVDCDNVVDDGGDVIVDA